MWKKLTVCAPVLILVSLGCTKTIQHTAGVCDCDPPPVHTVLECRYPPKTHGNPPPPPPGLPPRVHVSPPPPLVLPHPAPGGKMPSFMPPAKEEARRRKEPLEQLPIMPRLEGK